jgi:ABC-type antimicrobial peptide transport system ATPase subunit
MKIEKLRRYRVDWVEFGTLYFRWYKTEGSAKNFALKLIHEVQIPQHQVNVSHQYPRSWGGQSPQPT